MRLNIRPNSGKVMSVLGGKYSLRTGLRDRDGDKVPDVFDCAPNNPRKQGLVHDIGKKIAGALPEGKFKESTREYVEHREAVAEERKRTRRKAELEYAGKIEAIKSEARLKRKKAYYEGGGFFGAMGRATSGPKATSRIKKVAAPKTFRETSMFGGSGIMGSAGGLFGPPASTRSTRKAKRRKKRTGKKKGKQKQIVIKLQ